MATRYLDVYTDSWYADVAGSNFGAGAGKRLMSGHATLSGDSWTNRIGIAFVDNDSTGDETITQVLLEWVGMGSETCIGNGSNPNCYIERVSSVTDRVSENGTSANCTVTGTGGAAAKYPGPTTTTTNRVNWNPASVVAGTVYSIDITTLFMDWWAVRSFTPAVPDNDERVCFNIVVKAVSEGTDSQRFNIRSSEYGGGAIHAGGNGPQIKITYTTNNPPNTPSAVSPSGTINTGTPTYVVTVSDPDGDTVTEAHFNVRTSNAVDGNGKMNAGSLLWESGWVTRDSVSGSDNSYSHDGTAMTAGVQYYWQCRVRDPSGDISGWMAPVAYLRNVAPVPTKVRPA